MVVRPGLDLGKNVSHFDFLIACTIGMECKITYP